ncbi:OB fold (BOF) protein [Chitinophaga terrae (ex Kim and Jung 2007)]|jgi:uncharacterized protein YdeI (BOF family)|uniref:OB fold (BOF) protein n=1 Tax=Chitinophaga terrae (ex Kim and Jung 2007) TaxID=408074 RepID=A0A1H4EMU2_9BACT|nr:NirD/YgiW/YdeI family stress tolerance protein [Chitinophaga terrae (ex Kim and Jung 2007)]MDQ0107587.1 uncharacterized protein YdeI (BOF family) [Chitinophaga terrae (ex Kim and Jung 2007)]SEA86179.1 OB fold (BOF) protein [Chitinophaga terrae (ex Kim and Jung 2007)]
MKSLAFCLLFSLLHYQQPAYTIGEVMRKARQLSSDSTTVKITGYITKKLDNNKYLFEDRTAEIRIDIDPQYLQHPVSDKEAVVIKALVQYEVNKPITLKVNQPVVNE